MPSEPSLLSLCSQVKDLFGHRRLIWPQAVFGGDWMKERRSYPSIWVQFLELILPQIRILKVRKIGWKEGLSWVRIFLLAGSLSHIIQPSSPKLFGILKLDDLLIGLCSPQSVIFLPHPQPSSPNQVSHPVVWHANYKWALLEILTAIFGILKLDDLLIGLDNCKCSPQSVIFLQHCQPPQVLIYDLASILASLYCLIPPVRGTIRWDDWQSLHTIQVPVWYYIYQATDPSYTNTHHIHCEKLFSIDIY